MNDATRASLEAGPMPAFLDRQQLDAIIQTVPGGARNVKDIYPLAPLQEGLLFHRLLDERNDRYVLSILFELDSQTRACWLIDALQAVMDRHDVLRTAIVWEGLPRPVQVVYRQATLTVEEIVLDRGRDVVEQLRERMSPRYHALDLRRAPLLQLKLAADSQQTQWYALLLVHHVICDHESLNAVVAEALAGLEGQNQELPQRAAYRDYVTQALQKPWGQDTETFFRGKLGDVDEPTAPFGLMNVRGDGGQIQEAQQRLDSMLAHRVRRQARQLKVSAARLFHAAWALVIARTSGRDDPVFGTVLAARQKGAAGQRMLGMAVNTLPLRLHLRDVTARDLVEQTHREIGELLQHGQAPLTLVQRSSGVPGTAPLFTALLNFRHNDPDAKTGAVGVRVLARGEAWTNYPITLIVDDLGDDFVLTAQTDRPIDPNRLIRYVSTAMQSLLDALDQAPQTRALALPVLPESEWQQLRAFNSSIECAPQAMIHQLFEEQVRRTPRATAVICEGRTLTYAELNARANQLAHLLRTKGVGPDRLVGICVDRSLEMVVGLLGILKAGGAYVPLDPTYPADRSQYMLTDAAVGVLLSQQQLLAALPATQAEVITLDEGWSVIARQPSDNIDAESLQLKPHHLAYVIYTSGSTGRPKGVLVEHRNVTRLFAATSRQFKFNESDVWTLFHSYAFDFSVWELWGALLHGGRLVIVPHLVARSPQEFYRLMCDQCVTVLNQTPSAFVQLIEAQLRSNRQHSLRVVIFGGEALELQTLQPWVQRNGAEKTQLVNMYGITETTVHVTYRLLTAEEIESQRGRVIGEPLADLQVYVLNDHGQPAPIGVPGEMYVGGDGVARGYLNRPELTKERFVRNPFSSDTDARLYKTGDLGRWRADGALEYLGRNDHQVKIRGFRIELGEIEAHLARHEQVKEAAVIAREDAAGEKSLVAYVVARHADGVSVEILRTHLKATLPEYMVPSAFVLLERLPLTSNGKLDRRALPAPDLAAYASRDYEAPQGEVEEIVAGIWKQLLQVDRVGRTDDFFALGGHSLLAIQAVARTESLLSMEIPIKLLFDFSTVEQLSSQVSDLRRSRVIGRIAQGGDGMQELLDRVAAMSESQAQEWLRQLDMEGQR